MEEQSYKPRLIDEWQAMPPLWDAVRYKVDQTAQKRQFILTGSATPNHKGVLHSGAGRIARLRMRPMSLFEPGNSSGIGDQSADRGRPQRQALRRPLRPLRFGERGLPETGRSVCGAGDGAGGLITVSQVSATAPAVQQKMEKHCPLVFARGQCFLWVNSSV